MPGIEHQYITGNAAQLAGNCFPEKLWTEYCFYPDKYFGESEKLKKYYFETDGIQFHYPPAVDYGSLYRYWNVRDGRFVPWPFHNENYRHMIRGFNFYIRHTLKENEKECWKYAGWLVHAVEDSLLGVHTLENAGGIDLQALDRFGYFRTNPADILSRACGEMKYKDITDYQPCVLGRNAGETALNLYARYIVLGNSSRAASFRAIMDIHERNDKKSASQHLQTTFRNAVTLTADILYTLRLLREKKAAEQFIPLKSLTDMIPVRFPFGGGGGAYRFSSCTTDYALNKKGQKINLSILEKGRKKTFEKGFAFGVHTDGELLFRLPMHGYTSFSAEIGLHPDCDENEDLRIHWINAGKTVRTITFSGKEDVKRVRIENPRGWFGVKMESSSSNGVLVIGAPVLFH